MDALCGRFAAAVLALEYTLTARVVAGPAGVTAQSAASGYGEIADPEMPNDELLGEGGPVVDHHRIGRDGLDILPVSTEPSCQLAGLNQSEEVVLVQLSARAGAGTAATVAIASVETPTSVDFASATRPASSGT